MKRPSLFRRCGNAGALSPEDQAVVDQFRATLTALRNPEPWAPGSAQDIAVRVGPFVERAHTRPGDDHGPDVIAVALVHPGTQLLGTTHVAEGAEVGPNTRLTDTAVGEGARVDNTVALGAEIGPEASVGPFAYLRPGTRLARSAKAGTYVEMKNATIGEGTKVPHLSYVGDATIGDHSNIGAASVFVNYDGVNKHHTTIGSHCRTGSDNMFVAPVTLGDGVYTAAGSVITKDVPSGALAVARGQQRNIDGWVARKRPGSAAAKAAESGAEETPAES